MKKGKISIVMLLSLACILTINPSAATAKQEPYWHAHTDFPNIIATRLNTDNKVMYCGQTFSLKVETIGMKKKKIIWKSANKKIATVSSSGKVKAKAVGKTKITISIKTASATYKHTCKITVTPAWMNASDLKAKYNLTISYGKNIYKENTILIEPPEDTRGQIPYACISYVPGTLETGKTYTTYTNNADVRYMFDGTDILFNLEDLDKLKILV